MNKESNFSGVLFPEFNSTITEQKDCLEHKSSGVKRYKRMLNLHLHNSFPVEGADDMPLLCPFDKQLPASFIPFSERNKKQYILGVHCYLYDYFIEPIWNSPKTFLSQLRKYRCVIAPDYSIFVDQPQILNKWNVYRNRWVASYWQANHINVIPSASWGNVDSFKYCFDGLPENSVIAIGHCATGKDIAYKKLYRMGVEALIERKHPSKLLVYGFPLDFNVDVETFYIESKIQLLRKINRK